MGDKHSKSDTTKKVKAAMENNLMELYKQHCIKWRGISPDGELYSEIIAQELLKANLAQKLQSIKTIKRPDYKVVNHDGKSEKPTNRREEIFAKELLGKTLNTIGQIKDYQVPLKSFRSDKGVGKIDLISYSQEKSEPACYLIELKYKNNKTDTLLLSVLEIATYYQLLDKINFIKSYKSDLPNLKLENIRKAVLVFEKSSQHLEIEELQKGNRPCLRELVKELAVDLFLIKCDVTRIKI
jgi:hypothetical protein